MGKLDNILGKIQVTALARFKIQNSLLKKFGESGLKLYKEIDGQASSGQLAKKLGLSEEEFERITEYMEENGMIENIKTSAGQENEKVLPEEKEAEEIESEEEQIEYVQEKEPEEITSEVEAGPEETGEEIGLEENEEKFDLKNSKENKKAEEQSTQEKKEAENKNNKKGENDRKKPDMEIEPYFEEEGREELKPENIYGEGESAEEKKGENEETETEEPEEQGENEFENIMKDNEKEEFKEDEAKNREAQNESQFENIEEENLEPEEDFGKKEQGENKEENLEEKGAGNEEEEKAEEPPEQEDTEGDGEIEPYIENEAETGEKASDDSSVEKIIKDKYGTIGIAVYTLIDGQKSAEEIMKETGLTESKLVEILDYMEEKGIIKLEYPNKGKTQKQQQKMEAAPSEEESKFHPLTEERDVVNIVAAGTKTIDIPVKLNLDIVKSVQLKAKIMFDFGERGSLIFEAIDGKRNTIDIILKTNSSLEFATKIINFLMANNAIMLKPITREDIQKRYGVEAYRIYKRFGREGVLLYELIGKDMSIKQMMEKITKDKNEFVEIFIFVHEVLGVPIPVEKDILLKRLE